jgi:transglutaminase-like putative cysteine protease
LPPLVWSAIQVGFLLWLAFAGLSLGRHVLDLFAQLLIFVQVHRHLTRRGPRDDMYVVFLASGQMLLAAVLTVELGFLIAFIAFAFGVAIALPLTRARIAAEDAWAQSAGLSGVPAARRPRPDIDVDREVDALGRPVPLLLLVGLAAFVELVTAVLFVVLPRTQAAFLGGALAAVPVSGFSDRVRLGSVGTMQLSAEPVFRAVLTTPDGSPYVGVRDLHWFGLALDRFDGRGWELADVEKTPLVARTGGTARPPPKRRGWEIKQEITLEPLERPTLFHVAASVGLYGEPERMLAASTEGYEATTPRRRIRYTVYSAPRTPALDDLRGRDPRTAPPDLLARYTQLPETLDRRLRETADDWARGGAEGLDEVLLVQSRLLGPEFTYSLDQPAAAAADPLLAFVLDVKEGHCEYFATAMAVLLRARGLPARVVNGFLGGEWNPVGGYWLIRQRDAHSWVEVWFPGVGWVTFDPTPGGAAPSGAARLTLLGRLRFAADLVSVRWGDTVLGYGLDQQADAMRSVIARVATLPDVAAPALPGGRTDSDGTRSLSWPIAAVVALLLLVVIAARAKAPSDAERLVAAWARAADGDADAPPPDASTPAWAAWAERRHPEAMRGAAMRVARYEASRFGAGSSGDTSLRPLLAAARKLPTRSRRPKAAPRNDPRR